MYENESAIESVFYFDDEPDDEPDDELLEEDPNPSIPAFVDEGNAETEEELSEDSGVTWTRGPNGKLVRV